jgi:hypothetical protein
MQAINKTITRSPLDRKQRLLIPYRLYPALAWFALFLIAGLEIYYLNRYGDPDTYYLIGGGCTLVYGILIIMVFYKHRQNVSRLVALSRKHGGMIKEGLIIDDEGIKNFVVGYFSQRLSWSALSKYRNRKRHIEMNIAGIEFLLPKHNFSDAEIECINELLRSKLVDPHKRFFENDPPMSPPPFPQA